MEERLLLTPQQLFSKTEGLAYYVHPSGLKTVGFAAVLIQKCESHYANKYLLNLTNCFILAPSAVWYDFFFFLENS